MIETLDDGQWRAATPEEERNINAALGNLHPETYGVREWLEGRELTFQKFLPINTSIGAYLAGPVTLPETIVARLR